MPAAAVIPASAAYIKFAAVKRLAVESQYQAQRGGRWVCGVKLVLAHAGNTHHFVPCPFQAPSLVYKVGSPWFMQCLLLTELFCVFHRLRSWYRMVSRVRGLANGTLSKSECSKQSVGARSAVSYCLSPRD